MRNLGEKEERVSDDRKNGPSVFLARGIAGAVGIGAASGSIEENILQAAMNDGATLPAAVASHKPATDNGAPAADPVARQKLRWRSGVPGGWQLPGEPVGGRLVEFQRN